jgi:hypothetical protein
MDADETPDDRLHCAECGGVLEIQLWVLDPRDVALLHVCSAHGVAAISRPLR